MRITRGRVVLATVALATVVVAFLAFQPKPVIVDTALVERRDLASSIDADGRTRVRHRFVIEAPVGGRVERLALAEGALVRAGDVVARILPMPLDSQAVAQATARVNAALAIALEAGANMRTAAADLEFRRRELDRARRLLDAGGIAPRVVEEQTVAWVRAEEAVHAAEQRARAADADVEQARSLLFPLDPARGRPVLLRAPSSGRILRVVERSERIVQPGVPLLEIGDPQALEIVVDVLSSDAMRVRPGDPVSLRGIASRADGNSNEDAVAGRVRAIEPAGFTKVSALGVEEQRVNVIIDPGTALAAGDGFRVEASIIVWSATGVLAIPRSALVPTDREEGGAWHAFVLKGGRVQDRLVRIGHMGGGMAEVLDGLSPGEQVIVFPSDNVRADVRARARAS